MNIKLWYNCWGYCEGLSKQYGKVRAEEICKLHGILWPLNIEPILAKELRLLLKADRLSISDEVMIDKNQEIRVEYDDKISIHKFIEIIR